ncbi:MAG: RNA methyltransferase [Candidatus Omnitrophica bacterium]|nr:RNA methyltransferase [Candidatus Omnitrophota bacterium]
MQRITSVHNVLVKKALRLREAKDRCVSGETIIDGVREIKRALEAGVLLEKVFVVEGFKDGILAPLASRQVEIIETTNQIMEKLAYGKRHEGMIALSKPKRWTFDDLKLSAHPLVVIVEALEKPGNLGAILRTCDGVGVEVVFVCDPKTDVYNPNVIRSSTGTVFKIPVVCADAPLILSFLKSKKIKICAAAPEAKKIYTQVPLKGAWALVFGSEDEGLSDFWLKVSDETVRIPMKGMADSLNVSISAAIILYEAFRQRQI